MLPMLLAVLIKESWLRCATTLVCLVSTSLLDKVFSDSWCRCDYMGMSRVVDGVRRLYRGIVGPCAKANCCFTLLQLCVSTLRKTCGVEQFGFSTLSSSRSVDRFCLSKLSWNYGVDVQTHMVLDFGTIMVVDFTRD